jgi:hypothetical protein
MIRISKGEQEIINYLIFELKQIIGSKITKQKYLPCHVQ